MKRTLILLAAASLLGCASSETSSSDAGSGTGGSTATGSGGTTSTGQGGSGGSGGASATGGSTGTGGATATGGSSANGGATGAGGSATGGSSANGGATGAGGTTATGGSSGTGGSAGKGGASGGAGGGAGKGGASGSAGAGGASAGGKGGTASGGTTGTGGTTGAGGKAGAGGTTATGGTTGAGGSAGASALPSYFLGADVTDQEIQNTTTRANLLSIMQSHGFNFVRLRTFVDPKAADGYDQTNGYDDITHTVSFGQQVKAAGMGLLIDFHYSDNWADPGKQCIPVAWQGYTTIAALAQAVHDYTEASIQALVSGGARPDMVQIGNETTPGMLLDICDSGGQPTSATPLVTGSTSNWTNLGTLLKAGVQGVKDVDTGILISFHIDRGNDTNSSKSWLSNAIKQGATPDAFGESCYQTYQGDPNSQTNTQNGWQSTFSAMASAYPSIKFFAAEYGPMERQINDVVFGLAGDQGLGTFDWEPTTEGAWNAAQPSDPAGTTTHALLQHSGSSYTALPDLALFDAMKTAYASRLAP